MIVNKRNLRDNSSDSGNAGQFNSGNNNSGDHNSGDGNSGDWNSGFHNAGDANSGILNSGEGNAGESNSGYQNSGNWNSGHINSGNWSSGYGNSASRQSGIFNSSEETVRIFNKDSGKRWNEIDHPHFGEFYMCKWIPWEEMTDLEKQERPQAQTTKGYLKECDYKEAWANFWQDTDEKNRQKFLNLPNFDATIFKEITGIDVNIKIDATKRSKKKDEDEFPF